MTCRQAVNGQARNIELLNLNVDLRFVARVAAARGVIVRPAMVTIEPPQLSWIERLHDRLFDALFDAPPPVTRPLGDNEILRIAADGQDYWYCSERTAAELNALLSHR